MQRPIVNYHRIGLFSIIAVAAIFRLYHINQPFIDTYSWRETDMATMADNYYKGNWNIFYPEISWNGPGHNYVGYEFQTITYLSAILYKVFGQHEWIGRSIAILFSLLGIFSFYKLVSKLSTISHGLVSAAILAIMPGEIFHSRSFLPDPVMLSLVVTSFWLLVEYLQSFKMRYLVLACLAGMLGFLTKISGIIVGLPMLYTVVCFLKSKGAFNTRQIMRLVLAAVFTLLPVFAYYAFAVYISKTYPPYYIAANSYWIWKFGLDLFLKNNYFIPQLYIHLSWIWMRPILLLAVAGTLLPLLSHFLQRGRKKDKDNQPAAPWTFHWWLIAYGLLFALGAKGLVDNPSNLNLLNPPGAALAGSFLLTSTAYLEQKIKRPIAFVLTVLVLLYIVRLGYGQRARLFASAEQKDYELGLMLNKVSRPNDLVVTATRQAGSPVSIYYSQRRGWNFPAVEDWEKGYLSHMTDEQSIEALNTLINKGANWFGITNAQLLNYENQKPRFMAFIKSRLKQHFKNDDFVIYEIPVSGVSK